MPSILFITEFFPSIIQPWLLNTIEQACQRGRVTITAAAKGPGSTPPLVTSLGLLERTHYLQLTGSGLIRSVFSRNTLGNIQQFFTGLRRLGLPPLNAKAVLKHVALAHVAGRDHFDIAHAHNEILAFEYLTLCQKLGIPLVLTFHGKPPPGVAELSPEKRERLYKEAACVQVNTQFAATQVMALGCPSEKIRILPQGLQLDAFPYSPLQPPENGTTLKVLTVGRLQKDKGHIHAIEAIVALAKSGIPIQYRIVGSGPEQQALQKEISRLGASDYIKLTGPLPEESLLAEYRAAHIFILPSLRDLEGKHEETQGVVLQEAQACGKIVIATRVGGVPECLDDGASAFLIPDRNPQAIAHQINHILQNTSLWPTWQQQARLWVEQHYDIQVIGKRQWDIYKGLSLLDQ